MGLTNPPQVRVIYAECNVPGDGTEGAYEYDAWYDKASVDITASHVAALAAMGLEYDSGEILALVPMVVHVVAALTTDPSPGGDCTMQLFVPGFNPGPMLFVDNPNTLTATSNLGETFAMAVGDSFYLKSTCTNGTDTPITYAALSIVRLV